VLGFCEYGNEPLVSIKEQNIFLTSWAVTNFSRRTLHHKGGWVWEANSHLASEEIPHFLWNLKVHCCVHKSLPLVPVLIHVYSVHTFPPCIPKIHYNIMFLSTPRSSEWSLSLRFSDKKFVFFFSVKVSPLWLFRQYLNVDAHVSGHTNRGSKNKALDFNELNELY